MKDADIQHDKRGRDTDETEMATKVSEFLHKAKKDGPEKLSSGIQDSSFRRRLEGEREDQPPDGKTT